MKSWTSCSEGDDSLLVGVPDGSIVGKQREQSQSGIATIAHSVEPVTVTLPIAEEVPEPYLEIRAAATRAVITAIKIPSPKNKRVGEGKQAYERKRNQIQQFSVNSSQLSVLNRLRLRLLD